MREGNRGVLREGLVVEDDPTVAEIMAARLSTAMPDIRVHRAGSLEEARACLRRLEPDIVLLDVALPDGEGVALLRDRGLPKHCLVVMMTLVDDDEQLFAALRAGVTGYLLKNDAEVTMVDALKGVALGRPPLSPAIAQKILNVFRPAREEAPARLSPREREVLLLVAKGYSVRRAAELLDLKQSTVAGYLKTIYQKLQVSSRSEATMEAMRMGLVGLHTR